MEGYRHSLGRFSGWGGGNRVYNELLEKPVERSSENGLEVQKVNDFMDGWME
jgi:hypothetical protein